MGNKNYENKLNRGFRENVNPVDETNTESVGPVETEEPGKTEETVKTEEPVKPAVTGIVYDCVKLNLRSEPKRDERNENVISALIAGISVTINEELSTDEFYKVTTETGLEGYCMKHFIKLT